ncbi:MAG TPA: DUF5671 domain-containing protein [Candidatus Paceibacterota bacterium]|nr:DUF5671 domain-containing protein [Candidatus Paceibacterota bacterium]
MDKPRVTPKDFFLWAGALVTLYVSVFSFLALVFDYINYAFPDQLASYYSGNPYQGGVSYEMASLIVLFPIFLVLIRVIHNSIKKDPSRRDIWVRRWALYLTLFVAAATLAVDLITLIMYFLNGEISERFILKVLLVLLVAGAGFLHFIADLGGYWEENAQKAKAIAWGCGILIILTVGSGFLIIGTPMQARDYMLDEQKVNDLQIIQSEVVTYWQQKRVLPTTLNELNDPLAGVSVPNDTQTGQPYQYEVLGKLGFKLCATFNSVTDPNAITQNELTIPIPSGSPGARDMSDSWYHEAGTQCFSRTIDPSRYPPTK